MNLDSTFCSTAVGGECPRARGDLRVLMMPGTRNPRPTSPGLCQIDRAHRSSTHVKPSRTGVERLPGLQGVAACDLAPPAPCQGSTTSCRCWASGRDGASSQRRRGDDTCRPVYCQDAPPPGSLHTCGLDSAGRMRPGCGGTAPRRTLHILCSNDPGAARRG
jgi:hypothetical protein